MQTHVGDEFWEFGIRRSVALAPTFVKRRHLSGLKPPDYGGRLSEAHHFAPSGRGAFVSEGTCGEWLKP